MCCGLRWCPRELSYQDIAMVLGVRPKTERTSHRFCQHGSAIGPRLERHEINKELSVRSIAHGFYKSQRAAMLVTYKNNFICL